MIYRTDFVVSGTLEKRFWVRKEFIRRLLKNPDKGGLFYLSEMPGADDKVNPQLLVLWLLFQLYSIGKYVASIMPITQ